jgi:hypothetical protein
MKSWKTFLKEQQSKDLEQEGFTLFFKKNGKYYAVKESSRIIFAKIKTKDVKDISADKNEIKFTALELKSGENIVFTAKDIKDIEICEKEEAENVLSKK